MLTPQEEARLDYLNRTLGPLTAPAAPQPDRPGLLSRLGQGLANVPSDVGQILTNAGTSVYNMGLQDSQQVLPPEVPRPYDIPAPQTLGERLTDVVPGIASSLAAAAIPGGIVTRLGGGALLGNFAGGALLGSSGGAGDALATGSEFSAIHLLNTAPIPGYLKAIGNAAIPVGGQLLRGQNPLDTQSLINTGTNVLLPALLGGYGGNPRPLLRQAEQHGPYEQQGPFASPEQLLPEQLAESRANEGRDAGFVGPVYGDQQAAQLLARQQLQERYAQGMNADFTGPQQPQALLRSQLGVDGPPQPTSLLRTVQQPVTPEDLLFRGLQEQPSVETPVRDMRRAQELTGQEFPPDVASDPDASLRQTEPGSDEHHAAVEQAVKEVADQYPGISLTTARSSADVPEDLRTRMGDRHAEFEGVNDPLTGQQVIFSSQISDPARAREVAVHEVVGHYGVDRVLPPNEWESIQQHVFDKGGQLAEDIAQGYFRKGLGDVAGDATARRRVAREYVARLAENTNLDPTLWQQITAKIRAALRAVGIRREWSDNEIRDLIRKSHENLKSDKPMSYTPRPGPVDTASDSGADPSLPGRAGDLATAQEENRTSLLGAAARWAETNLNAGKPAELLRAEERAKGERSLLGDRASTLLNRPVPQLDDAQRQVVNDFLRSRLEPADIARFQSSGLPPEAIDYYTQGQAIKRAGQQVLSEGETAAHSATIDNTPDWQRRAFRIFTMPKDYQRRFNRGEYNDAVTAAARWLAPQPGFEGASPELIERTVRQTIHNKLTGKAQAPGDLSQRISQTLFAPRHDLTPDQWRGLEDLMGNRHLEPEDRTAIQTAIRERHVPQALRNRLRDVARVETVAPEDQALMRQIAEQETVAPEIRRVFGEHTSPEEVQAFTLQKIVNNVRQAKFISEVNNTALPDGRRLTYATAADLQRALDSTTGDARRALLGYKQIPPSDGYGAIAGHFADRSVLDAFDAFNQGMDSGGQAMFAKIQKWMKVSATILNPAAHAHNWMQAPLMMMIGRAYNPATWLDASRIVLRNRAEDAGIREELTRNNIIGAGFGPQELTGQANDLASVGQPQTIPDRLLRAKDHALRFMAELYSRPDDIVRAATYMSARARGMDEAAASDFTNRYSWNYGATSRAVKSASNIPGINPFISYSAELARVLKNLGEDVVNGTGEDRMHAVLNLALMASLPAAIGLGSEAMNLSQKDQEDWSKLRSLEPEYTRAQIKLVTGRRRDGTFDYFDLKPILPAGDVYTIARMLYNGDWKGALAEQPVVGLQHNPMFQTGMDVTTGRNQTTGELLNTPGKVAARIAQPLVPPLLGSQGQRLLRGFTPNAQGGYGLENVRTGREDTPTTSLLGIAGLRMSSEKPAALLRSAQADANEVMSDAKRTLMQTMQTNASPEAKQRALLRYQQDVQEAQQELLARIRQ